MQKSLCLVINPRRLDWRDIEEIAGCVKAMDPEISISVVTPFDTADAVHPSRWQHRTLTVALGSSGRFTPRRGPVFENRAVPKMEQYQRFLAAGIATPRTAQFEFGKVYSPEEWSDFVILKPLPLNMTSKTGQTLLYRTKRLAQLSLATLPVDHFLRHGPALVQEFIDTGLHPAKLRVLTMLGEPLYASTTRSAVPRVSLDASDEEIEASIVDAKNLKSRLADTEGQRNRLVSDPELLAFARDVHAAFPRRTLLGIDILKRESDGRLFALEVNAGGNVWHFSSPKEGHRKRLGGREAMIAQLDAWNTAARTLVKLTSEHAA